MKLIGFLFAGLLAATAACAAPAMEEGKQYERLTQPQPVSSGDKIEVIEFFWYGCPHCYHLEPEVAAWLKSKPEDVEFIRIPAVLGPSWELLARGYYTADLLGVVDKIHQPLFDYLHKDRKKILNVTDLKAFFVDHGVPGDEFDKAFASFAVVTKTSRADQADERYGIDGVPALIVAGKYRTSAGMAGQAHAKTMDVVDFLVAKEREARAEPKQTAAAH